MSSDPFEGFEDLAGTDAARRLEASVEEAVTWVQENCSDSSFHVRFMTCRRIGDRIVDNAIEELRLEVDTVDEVERELRGIVDKLIIRAIGLENGVADDPSSLR